MAAPVIAAVSSDKTGNTSTDITVTYAADGPSGISAGALLVAEVSATNASATVVPTIDTPADWDLWVSGPGPASGSSGLQTRVSVFTRIAQAGDTGVTFTASPNALTWGMTVKVARISGHDPTLYAHKFAAAVGVDGTSIDAPAVTTTIADCLIIGCAARARQSVAGWISGTWAEQWDFGTDPGSANEQTAASKTQAAAGSTGTNTFTTPTAGSLAAVTVAIAPATPEQGEWGWIPIN